MKRPPESKDFDEIHGRCIDAVADTDGKGIFVAIVPSYLSAIYAG